MHIHTHTHTHTHTRTHKHTHTHTHTHTHKDTHHIKGPVDWHTHINIYLHSHYILTAAIFIILNEQFIDTKKLTSTLSFLFICYSFANIISVD